FGLKNVALIGGLLKKRNNKLSLTQKGKKLMQPGKERELFYHIFTCHYLEYNLGSLDGYPQGIGLQLGVPFVIYTLLKHGKEPMETTEYFEKFFQAMLPLLKGRGIADADVKERLPSMFFIRLFERFLAYYGFMDTNLEKWVQVHESTTVCNPVLWEVFELNLKK
ncbi:MAG: hypothetical protein AAGI38_24695, partial [Bacteroidota bacterium]